jgi:hypothetical protein
VSEGRREHPVGVRVTYPVVRTCFRWRLYILCVGRFFSPHARRAVVEKNLANARAEKKFVLDPGGKGATKTARSDAGGLHRGRAGTDREVSMLTDVRAKCKEVAEVLERVEASAEKAPGLLQAKLLVRLDAAASGLGKLADQAEAAARKGGKAK